MLWLSFFLRSPKCVAQCKSSCSVTPRYLTWYIYWNFSPLLRKLRFFVIVLFLDLNVTSSVLLVFKDSLLALTHSTTSFWFLFICLFNFFRDFSTRSILVLSAKWCTVLNSIFLCRSLINGMNRRGPKTDPYGTPYFNSPLLDSDLLMLVNCILSLFRMNKTSCLEFL